MQALYITRVSEISDISSSSAASLTVLLTVLVDLDDSSVVVFSKFSVAPTFFPKFLAVV